MLEEIGISGDHSHRFDMPVGPEEPKVPLGRCRSGRENAEPILSVPDSQLRLNLSVDDPLVATGRIDHFISALCIQGTEPLLGKDQRKVSDAVVSRQLQRAALGCSWPGSVSVINDEHAVQAHDVVVEGVLCTVIVVPESAHLFLRHRVHQLPPKASRPA